MKKWEYKVIQLSLEIRQHKGPARLETLLNQLGDESWEVFDVDYNALTGDCFGIAKREKPA